MGISYRESLPDNLVVDAKVAMNQAVAHTRNAPPRYLWVLLKQAWWQSFDHFANDFETAHKSAFAHFIAEEEFLFQPLLTGQQELYFVTNVM